MSTILCDIDGTLSHRGKPDKTLANILYTLAAQDYKIVLLSARPARQRSDTHNWLASTGVLRSVTYELYLMPDTWPDSDDAPCAFKRDVVQMLRARGDKIVLAFEDDPDITKMYATLGIPVMRVNRGGENDA